MTVLPVLRIFAYFCVLFMYDANNQYNTIRILTDIVRKKYANDRHAYLRTSVYANNNQRDRMRIFKDSL